MSSSHSYEETAMYGALIESASCLGDFLVSKGCCF